MQHNERAGSYDGGFGKFAIAAGRHLGNSIVSKVVCLCVSLTAQALPIALPFLLVAATSPAMKAGCPKGQSYNQLSV